MRIATLDDLKVIINWIKSPEEAKLWGGPKVRFPLFVDSLIDDINFSKNHSYSFFDYQLLYGFAQVVDTGKNIGHLARVIVNPGRRRMGFGNRLIAHLIQHCDKNGYEQLTLNVYESNIPAISLYQSFGFQITEKDDSHSSLKMTRLGDSAD